jgi:hypothetical protein
MWLEAIWMLPNTSLMSDAFLDAVYAASLILALIEAARMERDVANPEWD